MSKHYWYLLDPHAALDAAERSENAIGDCKEAIEQAKLDFGITVALLNAALSAKNKGEAAILVGFLLTYLTQAEHAEQAAKSNLAQIEAYLTGALACGVHPLVAQLLSPEEYADYTAKSEQAKDDLRALHQRASDQVQQIKEIARTLATSFRAVSARVAGEGRSG